MGQKKRTLLDQLQTKSWINFCLMAQDTNTCSYMKYSDLVEHFAKYDITTVVPKRISEWRTGKRGVGDKNIDLIEQVCPGSKSVHNIGPSVPGLLHECGIINRDSWPSYIPLWGLISASDFSTISEQWRSIKKYLGLWDLMSWDDFFECEYEWDGEDSVTVKRLTSQPHGKHFRDNVRLIEYLWPFVYNKAYVSLNPQAVTLSAAISIARLIDNDRSVCVLPPWMNIEKLNLELRPYQISYDQIKNAALAYHLEIFTIDEYQAVAGNDGAREELELYEKEYEDAPEYYLALLREFLFFSREKLLDLLQQHNTPLLNEYLHGTAMGQHSLPDRVKLSDKK